MDVGVAHGARGAANLAERTLERFGFFFDAGDSRGPNEELEGGFDPAGGGAETVDALGGGFFQAVCDGFFELQALTKKDSDWLRHAFILPLQMRVGPE
jgi:hypothetical protein